MCVGQTWILELRFGIEAWERYLKYVKFGNQILFMEAVQADSPGPGPRVMDYGPIACVFRLVAG